MQSKRNKKKFKKVYQSGFNLRGSSKIFKFKKSKWSSFKKDVPIFNKRVISGGRSMQRLSSFFSYNWRIWQNIRGFYNINKKIVKNYKYIIKLERRLDVSLFRIRFFCSVCESRKAIKEKKILVNGFLVNSPNFIIKPGDIVTALDFNSNLRSRNFFTSQSIDSQLSNSSIFLSIPYYWEVSFNSKSAYYCYNPSIKEIPFLFEFTI